MIWLAATLAVVLTVAAAAARRERRAAERARQAVLALGDIGRLRSMASARMVVELAARDVAHAADADPIGNPTPAERRLIDALAALDRAMTGGGDA